VIIIWAEIGKRIKNLRNERKLTQAQFAKLIRKSAQYVGRIERGQKISVDLIAVICKEVDVTTDYIILGISDKEENMDFLNDFSREQIEICLEIVKKVTDLIKTSRGNALLLKELMRRQYTPQAT
jgi:transcriptional regulator with XRE-family HTH domain